MKFYQIISPFLVPTILHSFSSFLRQLSALPYPSVCRSDSLNVSQSPRSHTGKFLSHGNVPQMAELCSFILNLAHSPDPFAMAVGNTAYFPPSAPSPARTRPGPSCQVPDCNSQEQILCLACRCPSSASHQGLKSMFPARLSLAHTHP